MDQKLDLDAERAAALKEWQAQLNDLQRLLSRLRDSGIAFDPRSLSLDDWWARTVEYRTLAGEFWTVVERLDRLFKIHRRLEKAFRKKVHKIEVTIGVVASRIIHQSALSDSDRRRARDLGQEAAEALCARCGLCRLPDDTVERMDKALDQWFPMRK
jgi:hypothetical protein